MPKSQQELTGLVHEILDHSWLALEIAGYTLRENLAEQRAQIICRLQVNEKPAHSIEDTGVGMVDALFNGLRSVLVDEYPSLNDVHFVGFTVSGNFSETSSADASGSVHLVVENSSGRRFTFTDTSLSITGSSVRVVLETVEYFVNAELAVLRISDWIKDATRRGRSDLAGVYTQKLADLVQICSYAETIERKRVGQRGLNAA